MSRTKSQRLLWAVLAGLLIAVGPFRPRGFGYAVAAGVLAGLVTWVVVPRLSPSGDRAAPSPQRSAREEQGFRLSVEWPGLLCIGLYLVLYSKTLFWLYQNWTAGVWQNGHGLFVPAVMVLLGVRALRGEDWREAESSPWGLLVVALSLLATIVDLPLQTRYLTAVGFLVGIFGLALTLLGARRTRKLLLPLALGVFMFPIPFSISDQEFLRLATAIPTTEVLRWLGFSVVREYTVLLFPNFTIDISTACSGFSTLYAAVFFGVLFAAFSQPRWRQALVLVMIFPVALMANIIRALFLVELTNLYGIGVLATDVHPASGAATFVLVLVVLMIAAGRSSLQRIFE